MKRRLINVIVLSLIMTLLCGCSSSTGDESSIGGGGGYTDPTTATSIVIYYDVNENLIDNSHKNGPISQMAEEISMQMYADTFSIKAEPQYSTDEDERNKQIKDDIEQETIFTFERQLGNMNQYDRIYLGFTVYQSTIPQAVNGFLQSYDLSQYDIYVFSISDDGEPGGSLRVIQELTSNPLTNDNLCLESDITDTDMIEEVDNWLKSLPKKS
ncbi:MAG: hypothetical protein J6P61_06860 [Erysipelotrichaceae bacterium]|nr:hypothetical protein [Erysipelotrichaceae bacterium]